jgi:hypothetical protein
VHEAMGRRGARACHQAHLPGMRVCGRALTVQCHTVKYHAHQSRKHGETERLIVADMGRPSNPAPSER